MAEPITLERILTFLLEAPMFGDLDEDELTDIVHILQVQRVRAGHHVFREGDAGDAWFVIYEGRVEVLKDEPSGVTRITEFGPRSCFGEVALLEHGNRSASVRAITDCTLFKFPRADFEGLLQSDNLSAYKLIHQMARVLANRQRVTTGRLAELLAARDHDHDLAALARGHLHTE